MTLAHHPGWEEILLVGGPIVIIGFFLWLANKRAGKLMAEREAKSKGDVLDSDATDQPTAANDGLADGQSLR